MGKENHPAKGQGNLVPIMPVPVVFSVGLVDTRDGQKLIHVKASTPLGAQSYFINPDAGMKIAETIYNAAQELMAAEIVVPDTADILDISKKNGHKH